MARKKLENRNVRKIQKGTGGTYTVSIPIEAMRELNWREGQKVVVERKGKTITVVDWK